MMDGPRGCRAAGERCRVVRRWCVQRLPRPGPARRRGPRSVVTGLLPLSESLWTNADDRLPVASLGRVQRGDCIVEGRDVADVGPQATVAHPLDNLTQLGTIGLDEEVGG